MGILYGRAGRLTAKNGGFRPRADCGLFYYNANSKQQLEKLQRALQVRHCRHHNPYLSL